MAGYGSPRWSGKGPMAVNPMDTASCHGMPGTHRHHHKPGVAGERPHLGKATGPPQPEAHPEDPGSSFGHNTVSLPRLAPAQSLQSSSSCSWIPPNPAAPPVPWPKCPKICWQHHPGSWWALVWGGRAGTDTLREGLCLLSHRHPSQSGHGLPGPCQLHSYREAPATWVGTDPRYPGLQQPWHGQWGWWALAVPEGLSAGEERAASLLHDCVCRAGLGEAVVPSSSLSCWADGCPLAAPAPGSVPTGPAPEGPWWDPGYLAHRSHR